MHARSGRHHKVYLLNLEERIGCWHQPQVFPLNGWLRLKKSDIKFISLKVGVGHRWLPRLQLWVYSIPGSDFCRDARLVDVFFGLDDGSFIGVTQMCSQRRD